MNRAAETRAAIRAGETLSLRQLFTSQSLLFSGSKSVKGYGGGSGRYGQASSVIQFLKEGPFKDKFPDFFKRMGRVPRGNIEEIEKVIQQVYGLSLEGLEERWKGFFLN